ncbi:hypothetical protein TUM15774_20820 [Neisseria gonorrhoeae]|nr:hypothetical protein TUM15774_20820 [Neisseria gonorrhoeae]
MRKRLEQREALMSRASQHEPSSRKRERNRCSFSMGETYKPAPRIAHELSSFAHVKQPSGECKGLEACAPVTLIARAWVSKERDVSLEATNASPADGCGIGEPDGRPAQGIVLGARESMNDSLGARCFEAPWKFAGARGPDNQGELTCARRAGNGAEKREHIFAIARMGLVA